VKKRKGGYGLSSIGEKLTIRVKDVEKFKRSVKVGDKFIYGTDQVAVVATFKKVLQIKNIKNQEIIRTISFNDLFMSRRGLMP
jgi:helix-turn-helix protein